MSSVPLPARAQLLQLGLTCRAIAASSRADYYAIADMARGAALIVDDARLCAYLIDIAADAEILATQEAT